MTRRAYASTLAVVVGEVSPNPQEGVFQERARMKAEHRKQLQTNVLADRMGKVVQALKTKPQKKTVLWFLLIVAVVVAVFFYMRSRSRKSHAESTFWKNLENAHKIHIEELGGIKEIQKDDELYIQAPADWSYSKTNVGKAARFQYAYYSLWERGLKRLAADPKGAINHLEGLTKPMYRNLAKLCKDDPIWEPEALYNLAVIEETLAVKDRVHLDYARDLYLDVAEKFSTSVWGKKAEVRAELLKDSKSAKYKELAKFYGELGANIGIGQPK